MGSNMNGCTRAARSWRRVSALGLLTVSLSGCSTLANVAGLQNAGPAVRPVQSATASGFEGAMTQGKAAFAAGDYDAALGQFGQALLAQPDSVRALNALAATHDQLRQFDLADRYYALAFRLQPDSAELINNIGYSHLMRGDAAGAARYFAQAKQLDPGNQVLLASTTLAQDRARGTGAMPTTPAMSPAISPPAAPISTAAAPPPMAPLPTAPLPTAPLPWRRRLTSWRRCPRSPARTSCGSRPACRCW
ncbi:MAG: tetratricopeptide repeat protein [Dongiaceae bacterium]